MVYCGGAVPRAQQSLATTATDSLNDDQNPDSYCRVAGVSARNWAGDSLSGGFHRERQHEGGDAGGNRPLVHVSAILGPSKVPIDPKTKKIESVLVANFALMA